jgi:uncharacterized protein (UPF0261 family)
MKNSIVILCTLDTKYDEVQLLKEVILDRGHMVLIIDMSLGKESQLACDITPQEIAEAAGSDIKKVRDLASKDRGLASTIMTKGGIVKARELMEKDNLHGIISLGGCSNTAMATTVMKSLPFGIPKLMVSSAASMPAYAAGYIGTSDITMMHSVVDFTGTNDLIRDVLARAGGAICGMVEKAGTHPGKKEKMRERPLIAISEFNFCDTAARLAIKYLEEEGFDSIPMHAQGSGDRAMEELIEQGFFDGVIDFVTAGVSEHIFGGNRSAGPTRLEAAGKMGIPQVLAPSGLEMISCGPISRKDKDDPLWTSRKLSSRKLFLQDDYRVQARTTRDELCEIALTVAQKLNKAKGPVRFLIPLRGWSTLTTEGAPFCEPETDKVFSEMLKEHLMPEIEVIEMDVELNSPEFVRAAVDALIGMMGAG